MKVTNTFLENGYIIHNDKQISVEINEEVKLLEVKNMDEFVSKIEL
jgi:hypothetical protein